MMLELESTIPEAQKAIRALRSRIGRPDSLLSSLGREMRDQTVERIRRQKTSPDGHPWQRWSDSYSRARTGRPWNDGFRRRMMVKSGALVRSIQYSRDPNSVTVGSPIKYAAFHQTGTRKMPARPILGISAQNGTALESIALEWMVKIVARGT